MARISQARIFRSTQTPPNAGTVRDLTTAFGTGANAATSAQYAAGGIATWKRWNPHSATAAAADPAGVSTATGEGWRDTVGENTAEQVRYAAGTWTVRVRLTKTGQTIPADIIVRVMVIVYRVTSAGAHVAEIGRATSPDSTLSTATLTLSPSFTTGSPIVFDAGDKIQVEAYVTPTVAGIPAAPAAAVNVNFLVDETSANSGASITEQPTYNVLFSGNAVLAGTGTLTATLIGELSGTATLLGLGSLGATLIGIHTGSAPLVGQGSLVANGMTITAGSVAFSGEGLLSVAGTRETFGTSGLVGTSSLLGSGLVVVTAAGSLGGVGSLSAAGTRETFGIAQISGTGTTSATGTLQAIGSTQLTGASFLAANGYVEAFGTAALLGVGSLVAVGVHVLVGQATLVGTGRLSLTFVVYLGEVAVGWSTGINTSSWATGEATTSWFAKLAPSTIGTAPPEAAWTATIAQGWTTSEATAQWHHKPVTASTLAHLEASWDREEPLLGTTTGVLLGSEA